MPEINTVSPDPRGFLISTDPEDASQREEGARPASVFLISTSLKTKPGLDYARAAQLSVAVFDVGPVISGGSRKRDKNFCRIKLDHDSRCPPA